MNVLGVALLVLSSTSAIAAQLRWWQTGVIYQVYPRSLKDGDGTGDLRGNLSPTNHSFPHERGLTSSAPVGIVEKLEYLAGLGVAGVWIQPVFKSPMADNGYDVSDWTQVDPIFGTTADLQELIAEAHRLGE